MHLVWTTDYDTLGVEVYPGTDTLVYLEVDVGDDFALDLDAVLVKNKFGKYLIK